MASYRMRIVGQRLGAHRRWKAPRSTSGRPGTRTEALLKPHGRLALWVHRYGQFRAALKPFSQLEVYRSVRVQTGSIRPTLVDVRRV